MTTTSIVVCKDGVHHVVGTADISFPLSTKFADKDVEKLVQNAVIKDFSILVDLPYTGEVKQAGPKINVISRSDGGPFRPSTMLPLEEFLSVMRGSISGTLYTSGDDIYFAPNGSNALYKAQNPLNVSIADYILFVADVYKTMQDKI